ncbi:hypothetical protein [Sphingomonas sp.]|uniref:hypothetical protein n=1 Tax=Sphingomonas sp. TaxID=28214 RepID=UPI002DD69F22|nr:hypothetical protein [Sphingomonas sp.]
MYTPGPSEFDGDHALYGIATDRINRRLLLAGLAAIPLIGLADAAEAQNRRDRQRRGRRTELKSARWEGTGKIYFGDRGWVEIGFATTMEPFVRVRSESWVVGEPAADRRTLVIEPNEAYSTQGGRRTDLSAQQAAHERQQYGVYAYMLGLGRQSTASSGARKSAQPGFPEATLYYDGDRVSIIDIVVDAPRPGPRMTERFTLTGELASGEARFPQKIAILQDLRPAYELQVTKFEATYA